MLDALKRMGSQKPRPQTDSPDALLEEVRREKAELSGLLAQVAAQVERIEAATRAATEAAEADAQKQRQVAQQLAAQALQSRATLDTLAEEREALDLLRADVQRAVVDLHQAREATLEANTGLVAMREIAAGLAADEERLRVAARQTRDDAETAAAAVRETLEETGLLLPEDAPLTLAARAITPTNSPVRFHARFFRTDADHATGTLGDSDELSELAFRPLAEARKLPLFDITEAILDALIGDDGPFLFTYARGKPRLTRLS